MAIRRRHFLISAVIPYCYILSLGLGLLLVTLVAGSLQALEEALTLAVAVVLLFAVDLAATPNARPRSSPGISATNAP